MMGQVIEIKRYISNRKYWSTRHRSYVNLTQLESLIKEGFQLSVVSYPLNQDVTDLMLKNLLLRRERRVLNQYNRQELIERVTKAC